MSTKQCDACAFFKAESGSRTDDEYGECRRYPPRIVLIPEISYRGYLSSHADQASSSVWPVVDYHSWCGEWKPAT